jgi:hypothetical protein
MFYRAIRNGCLESKIYEHDLLSGDATGWYSKDDMKNLLKDRVKIFGTNANDEYKYFQKTKGYKREIINISIDEIIGE